MQMFLTDLRLWLDQVELGIRGLPNGDRSKAEREVVQQLVQPVSRSLNYLFEKFELVSAAVEPELQPVHSLYAKRLLHPLLLASPFMHRIYRKPLGYAGDYEMVNMILRDPHEGSSVFSKVLNCWFLSQMPAEAHRNRVTFLTRRLLEEGARAKARGARLRVFNLGCGPAREVQDFLAQQEISNQTDFTLLDFNEETLAYTEGMLNGAKNQHRRATAIRMLKKSVVQVLKAAGRGSDEKYDLVYCAGLFDYLQQRVCKQLMNMFYDMLAPGGLLIATNVDAANPIQRIMGYIFEWHLIYRTGQELAAAAPDDATPDDYQVTADITGCNIFIEVRKPPARP
jgi:extracellular factor (EF) 3-hydroxypalmitic acid methyl ester biosynthesis protein